MGAGIVGLSTAYALTQRGHRVTVIDQAEAGQGASGGNGAQLSYAYIQPMADPGIWAQLPKLLLSPSSALKIRPQWDPAQWSWLLQFLKACNTTQSQSTTAQLLRLAAQSRATLDLWRTQETLDFDFTSSGKLVMFRSVAAFEGAANNWLCSSAWAGHHNKLSPATKLVPSSPLWPRAVMPLQAASTPPANALPTASNCASHWCRFCRLGACNGAWAMRWSG
jgi:D-amino-acid dehydrogenase